MNEVFIYLFLQKETKQKELPSRLKLGSALYSALLP